MDVLKTLIRLSGLPRVQSRQHPQQQQAARGRPQSTVAANDAIADVAGTPEPDVEAPLDRTSITDRICRICLSAGSTEHELIEPCACAGTMGYIHAACLTAWVQAKGGLACEVCQQQYKEPFLQALQQQQPTAATGAGHEELQTRTINRCDCYGIGQIISLLIITACFVIFAVFASGGAGAARNLEQTTVAPSGETAVAPSPPSSAPVQPPPGQAGTGHIQGSPVPCDAATRARFRVCG